ncbi:uncharacterized protein E5676_scaffold349G00040 [Cucumis melo var. makuwa]|uniref:Uncharacterized protein n=1 Tax=Cucumis melo var. makuwa TaxID=1194695 RepID=A0A5D3E538_CUCMM|nr:uncharacterized protein E5676_scaffold349G00040 [Cucumis melo var. makuwa]
MHLVSLKSTQGVKLFENILLCLGTQDDHETEEPPKDKKKAWLRDDTQFYLQIKTIESDVAFYNKLHCQTYYTSRHTAWVATTEDFANGEVTLDFVAEGTSGRADSPEHRLRSNVVRWWRRRFMRGRIDEGGAAVG